VNTRIMSHLVELCVRVCMSVRTISWNLL